MSTCSISNSDMNNKHKNSWYKWIFNKLTSGSRLHVHVSFLQERVEVSAGFWRCTQHCGLGVTVSVLIWWHQESPVRLREDGSKTGKRRTTSHLWMPSRVACNGYKLNLCWYTGIRQVVHWTCLTSTGSWGDKLVVDSQEVEGGDIHYKLTCRPEWQS